MSESKTLVFGDTGANGGYRDGFDPNFLIGAMMGGGGFGGFGGGANWLLPFLLFALWGNGGFGGWGNNGGRGGNGFGFISDQLNNEAGRDLIMQGLQCNRSAIDQLASTLGCSVSEVRTALSGINTQLCNLGNQVGMSSMQVINAISSGNSALQNQLAQCCCDIRTDIASCCCDLKNAVTNQGYENRIATIQQTNEIKDDAGDKFTAVVAKIDAQTQLINDRFCDLEKRELQREINTLRDEKNAYQMSALSQTQTSTLINTLRPCPVPAYITCNPFGCNGGFSGYGAYPYGAYPYGDGSGCGC